MQMKVLRPLIIGSEGNMAKRYKAILNKLINDWVPNDGYGFDHYEEYDLKTHDTNLYDKIQDCKPDGFIICTPTHTHSGLIYFLAALGKPILCEKPIVKKADHLTSLISFCRRENVNLRMINQYQYLVDSSHIQYMHMPGKQAEENIHTYYDFFKHGDDGLIWDCINILGLAKGTTQLDEISPTWECKINSEKLSLSDMDGAYIRMLLDWLKDPTPNIDYIEHSHKAVLKYSENC